MPPLNPDAPARQHFSNLAAVCDFVHDHIGRHIADAIDQRGRCQLMATGGQTSRRYLMALAGNGAVAWDQVTIRLSDERFVPIDSPDSNEGMIRAALGDAGAGAEWAGLWQPAATKEIAADAAATRYDALPWPTDFNMLGMGDDGHIASIFPDTAHPDDRASVFGAVAADGSQRLSLPARRLLDTRRIYLITGGAKKLEVLEHALRPGRTMEFPVRLLLHQTQTPVHIISFD